VGSNENILRRALPQNWLSAPPEILLYNQLITPAVSSVTTIIRENTFSLSTGYKASKSHTQKQTYPYGPITAREAVSKKKIRFEKKKLFFFKAFELKPFDRYILYNVSPVTSLCRDTRGWSFNSLYGGLYVVN